MRRPHPCPCCRYGRGLRPCLACFSLVGVLHDSRDGALVATTQPRSTSAEARLDRLERQWAGRPGVLGWLTTTDHKKIGILYFWTTLVLFGIGGAEALLIRTQL